MKYKTNPNEPNFKKVKMNVSEVYTMDYEYISNWAKRTQFKPNFSQKMQKQTQNEPKTNPISPPSKGSQKRSDARYLPSCLYPRTS